MKKKIREMGSIGMLLVVLFYCLAGFSGFKGAAYADTEKLTVAVFDFESRDKGIASVGRKVSSLIEAELSSDPKLKVVERET